MWCKKDIIKATHQRDLAVQHAMPEQTEHFLRKLSFLQTVKMIERCLCRPAQKDGRGYMRLTPVHDLRDLFPVIHLFKLHILDRCTGDNHAIVFIFFHILKMQIEFIQMAGRGILGFVTVHR